MKLNSIKQWAYEDRPREKLISKGREALSNAELLAIIIGSGTTHFSAVEIARGILDSCDNELSKLSRWSVERLLRFTGIGEAKAVTIYAAMELARRRGQEVREKCQLVQSSADAHRYLRARFVDLSHEEFHVIYLNRRNEIIMTEQLSKGGISGTVADGRLIFHRALEFRASAIVLAHNHPSGQLKPSESDIKLTQNLVKFGDFIELRVLDHLILVDNNYFSFADEGML